MLSIKNRLKKDSDFRKVFSSSKQIHSGKLSIRFRPNNLPFSRFGFVISNKIDKRSTRRNSLKRRLRAITRRLILEIKPGYDIVVIVKGQYLSPSGFAEIEADLERGLKLAGLI